MFCFLLFFFFWGGGGGGELHLQRIYFLFQKLLFSWVHFNHDQTKFRTKLTCLLKMNLETSRISSSIMLPVLSFVFNLAFYEFKPFYCSSHYLNLYNRIFVTVFTRLYKTAHKGLHECVLECNISCAIFCNYCFCSLDLSCKCDLSPQNGTRFIHKLSNLFCFIKLNSVSTNAFTNSKFRVFYMRSSKHFKP